MDETFLQRLPSDERERLLHRAALFWPGTRPADDSAATKLAHAFKQLRPKGRRAHEATEQVRIVLPSQLSVQS